MENFKTKNRESPYLQMHILNSQQL